jgi:hypothetical protein
MLEHTLVLAVVAYGSLLFLAVRGRSRSGGDP